MVVCASCGKPLRPTDPRPTLRSSSTEYHLSCAPLELVELASEEYRAILRKGVRYFLEKYSGPPGTNPDLGVEFLELGKAVEAERALRTGT